MYTKLQLLPRSQELELCNIYKRAKLDGISNSRQSTPPLINAFHEKECQFPGEVRLIHHTRSKHGVFIAISCKVTTNVPLVFELQIGGGINYMQFWIGSSDKQLHHVYMHTLFCRFT